MVDSGNGSEAKVVTSVAEVVAADLCVGCGLCEAVSGGRVTMRLTPSGSLRPGPLDGLTNDQERAVLAACPGVVAGPRPDPAMADGEPPAGELLDPVWGRYRSMTMAWAGDPDVRFRAATGGVLTALGRHLVGAGEVAFVLHVGPDPDRPLTNRWVLSETKEGVSANTGSRYNPTAPLAGLVAALDRGEPFAVIAKPCDLGAIHRFATVDSRVDELCRYRLAMVCGGQSRLTKTVGLIEGFGLAPGEVAAVSYRGHGNPGPTTVTTQDGTVHRTSYAEMWADESSWDVETRCKLCPDALGECADIAAADAWPGGGPAGEDEGFNAVVVRTKAGERLMSAAVDAGNLVVGEPVTASDLNDFQPHQVRKKQALASRYQGMADAGVPPIQAPGLRLDELGNALDEAARRAQREGTARRLNTAPQSSVGTGNGAVRFSGGIITFAASAALDNRWIW